MIFKKLLDRPVLAIGIILMFLFLSSLARKSNFSFSFRNEKLIPTSCRAVLVKLNRRIPETWETKCNGNNLTVSIIFESKEKFTKEGIDRLRAIMYRELANDMIIIARHSPEDNLERTEFVTIVIDHSSMKINALTEGKFMYKLATIKDKGLLMQHLKATVKVNETVK